MHVSDCVVLARSTDERERGISGEISIKSSILMICFSVKKGLNFYRAVFTSYNRLSLLSVNLSFSERKEFVSDEERSNENEQIVNDRREELSRLTKEELIEKIVLRENIKEI